MAEDTSTLGSRLKAFISKEKTNAKADAVVQKIQNLAGEPISDEFKSVLKRKGVADQASIYFESLDIKNKIKMRADEAAIPIDAKRAAATTTASEMAKLDPQIVAGQMDVKRQEKQQDFEFNRKEAFSKIQEDLIKKGTELTTDEKTRLVSAKQGQESIVIANDLLQSEDFNRLVIQQGIKGGKLTTFGETNLRKYNTAIGDAIFNYVFAKSGAQVSDKERGAFEELYGIKLGDTKESAEFKLERLNRFFVLADEIFDPNKIAGLTVAEMRGRLNEIDSQLNELGGGDSKQAKEIMKGIKDRALGGGSNESSNPEDEASNFLSSFS